MVKTPKRQNQPRHYLTNTKTKSNKKVSNHTNDASNERTVSKIEDGRSTSTRRDESSHQQTTLHMMFGEEMPAAQPIAKATSPTRKTATQGNKHLEVEGLSEHQCSRRKRPQQLHRSSHHHQQQIRRETGRESGEPFRGDIGLRPTQL